MLTVAWQATLGVFHSSNKMTLSNSSKGQGVGLIKELVLGLLVALLVLGFVNLIGNSGGSITDLLGFNQPDDWMENGDQAYQEGDYDKALKEYRKIVGSEKPEALHLRIEAKLKIAVTFLAYEDDERKFDKGIKSLEEFKEEHYQELPGETIKAVDSMLASKSSPNKKWVCCDLGHVGSFYVYNVCSSQAKACGMVPDAAVI